SPEKVAVIEPLPSPELAALSKQGLRLNPPHDVVGAAAAVVVAVKPQIAPEALPALAPFVGADTVVGSIMAGRALGFLTESFPRPALVRAMPNTPAAIGGGITVGVANPLVAPEQRALVDVLLSAVGGVEWITDEALMDAVTALSGSGPAYVFLLAESIA